MRARAATRHTQHMLGLQICYFNKICFQSKGMGLRKYTDHKSGKFLKLVLLKFSLRLKISREGESTAHEDSLMPFWAALNTKNSPEQNLILQLITAAMPYHC